MSKETRKRLAVALFAAIVTAAAVPIVVAVLTKAFKAVS